MTGTTHPPICEKLRERCVDWDGTQIPDEGGARTEPTCGELREAASQIIVLVSALERCDQIVERHLYRQHEKVEDVRFIVRSTLAAIMGANT